jgi:hypothetical protein
MTMKELLELPVVVDLRTAARAFGIGKNKAYELAAAGNFPCPVLRFGQKYRVTRPHLFRALGLDPAMDLEVCGGRGDDNSPDDEYDGSSLDDLGHGRTSPVTTRAMSWPSAT